MDEGNAGGNRERLTKDRICEVALQAIDAGGLESMSMRSLARALGVKASSLYYHFDSKEELLTGVAEYLYRRLGRPPSTGIWSEQVRGTFVQLYEFIQGHPNAAPLLLRDLAYSPVARKRANVLLRIVARAGLDTNASASLISNLVALLVGHTLLSVWLREGSGSATEGEATHSESDAGSIVDTDGSRPWVQRLFAAQGLKSVQDEAGGFAGAESRIDGAVAESLIDAGGAGSRVDSATAGTTGISSGQIAGLQIQFDLPLEADEPPREATSPNDLAFQAGLDALIEGFSLD